MHANATKNPPPAHVAIIPDGNRRWVRKHGLSLMTGYDTGIKKFIEVAMWAKEMGVKTISIWGLSTENVKNRSSAEINTLFKLYMKAATDPKILKQLDDNRARVRVIGDMAPLPKKLKKELKALEARTRAYKDFSINILVGYGGRDDILYAAKKLLSSHKRRIKLTYETLRENLRTATLPDVDLLIRTSGEMRLSGFLPWQGSYSELYFSKKYWPGFGKEDLKRAIASFSDRERRYGK